MISRLLVLRVELWNCGTVVVARVWVESSAQSWNIHNNQWMTGHNVDTKTVSDSFLRCLCVCCIQSNDISELLILIPGHYPGPDADTDNYNRKLQEVKTRSSWRCPDWSTLIIFQKIEIQTITGQVNGLGVSAGGSGPDTRQEQWPAPSISAATGGILMTQSYDLYI